MSSLTYTQHQHIIMQEHQRNSEKHWVSKSCVAFSFERRKMSQIPTSDSASFFAPMSLRDTQYYAAGTNPQPSWLVAESELNGVQAWSMVRFGNLPSAKAPSGSRLDPCRGKRPQHIPVQTGTFQCRLAEKVR